MADPGLDLSAFPELVDARPVLRLLRIDAAPDEVITAAYRDQADAAWWAAQYQRRGIPTIGVASTELGYVMVHDLRPLRRPRWRRRAVR